MSPTAKKGRRERIARVAEHRRSPQMTYWLSRNLNAGGDLADHVDVWLVKPERVTHTFASGARTTYWRIPSGNDDLKVVTGSGPMRAHMGTWTLDYCMHQTRVVPDDDLQLIRNGEPSEPAVATEEPS